MPNDRIPLSDALEHFCDRQIWLEYLACFRDKRAALEALQPSGRWIFEQIARERPGDPGKSIDLGDRLVNELKQKLKKGDLEIAGFHMQSSTVRSIPSALCGALSLSFIDDCATFQDNRYSIVTVRHALAAKTLDASDLCETWLRERREQYGDEKRAALAALARAHFGSITDVAFGAAYTRVYGRKRGKPRKA